MNAMSKTPKEQAAKTRDVELYPDAWQRFERAAGAVAKSPPQHRVAIRKRL
jgi:hypothetical protein